jgi:diaminopimelate decarboxylase
MHPCPFPNLKYHSNRLLFGSHFIDELVSKHQTPCYIYDIDFVRHRYEKLFSSLPQHRSPLVCYAVKANPSLAILSTLARVGSGADVVSLGELKTAIKAGIKPEKIVFSGVAKTFDEIVFALQQQIFSCNVESPGEITRIKSACGNLKTSATLSLRLNPDIDAKTHPKIATGLHATKFGLDLTLANELASTIRRDTSLQLKGVSIHIGSQMFDLSPLKEAISKAVEFADHLRQQGHLIEFIDVGGGLGVAYRPEEIHCAPPLEEYGQLITTALGKTTYKLVLEPGRALVAEAGILISKVIEVKKTGNKTFVMIDAGMNDLARPSLYEAYHHILPVWRDSPSEQLLSEVDVVGPVCETTDIFASDRMLPPLQEGHLVAITHAGAYGSSMASTYNQRPLACELGLIEGEAKIIRKRQQIDDLWRDQIYKF